MEEHSNKQRTPYLFTGKELDEETGLYYFGARYYDHSQMGGATAYTYQYDDLYRLTDSTGTFDTAVGGSGPDKQHAYTLNMQYNNIHNKHTPLK